MPKDHIAPTIHGRQVLRTGKALVNLHEGNVRFELPSRDPLLFIFPERRRLRSKQWDHYAKGKQLRNGDSTTKS